MQGDEAEGGEGRGRGRGRGETKVTDKVLWRFEVKPVAGSPVSTPSPSKQTHAQAAGSLPGTPGRAPGLSGDGRGGGGGVGGAAAAAGAAEGAGGGGSSLSGQRTFSGVSASSYVGFPPSASAPGPAFGGSYSGTLSDPGGPGYGGYHHRPTPSDSSIDSWQGGGGGGGLIYGFAAAAPGGGFGYAAAGGGGGGAGYSLPPPSPHALSTLSGTRSGNLSGNFSGALSDAGSSPLGSAPRGGFAAGPVAAGGLGAAARGAGQGSEGGGSLLRLGPGELMAALLQQPGMLQPSLLHPSSLQPNQLQPSLLQPSLLQPSLLQPSLLQPSLLQPSLLQALQPGPGTVPASTTGPPAAPSTALAEPALPSWDAAGPGGSETGTYGYLDGGGGEEDRDEGDADVDSVGDDRDDESQDEGTESEIDGERVAGFRAMIRAKAGLGSAWGLGSKPRSSLLLAAEPLAETKLKPGSEVGFAAAAGSEGLGLGLGHRYGRAEPLACGTLPAMFPPIRPSRLGICPGRQLGEVVVFQVANRGEKGGGGGRKGREGRKGGEEEGEDGGSDGGWEEDEEEEDDDDDVYAEDEIDNEALVEAIEDGLMAFRQDKTENASESCGALLDSLLDICESTFGFIASNFRMPDGAPCLKTHAITNILWTDKLRAWFAAHAAAGLVFTDVAETGLFGRAALGGEAVWSDDPPADSLPKGHPRVNTAFAMPLICGTSIVGVAVVANRIGGYSEGLLRAVQPLLSLVAAVLFCVHWRNDGGRDIRRRLVSIAEDGHIVVDGAGRITSMDAAACAIFGINPLTAALMAAAPATSATDPASQAEGAADSAEGKEAEEAAAAPPATAPAAGCPPLGQLSVADLITRIGDQPVTADVDVAAMAQQLRMPHPAVGKQQGGAHILLQIALSPPSAGASAGGSSSSSSESAVHRAVVRLLARSD
ncbi:hypothetical protein CLOP_g8609 [Closterium sp. NIES-67]|nr:hypothetical protein CLOP_g8609 [Closterium sp. NIES-67]